MALVPRDDKRVAAQEKRHENLTKFLEKFTDAFGNKLEPALIIVRQDTPQPFMTTEALAGFRDLVAMSVVPLNRAREMLCPGRGRIGYSDAFRLYPWTLDRNYKDLIAGTPALLGLHSLNRFNGQSTPDLSPCHLSKSSLDEPLLEVLVRRWQRRFSVRKAKWSDIALFRSLNMANQAALIPAGTENTLYDAGRSIALWVSACEILAHPGQGKSGIVQVYELLDQVHWLYSKSRHRLYKPNTRHQKGKKGQPTQRRTIAAWLYSEIYRARNDFIHGNPVSNQQLYVRKSNRTLFQYAAPVYRMVLTGFLDLWWNEPFPSTEDGGTKLGEYVAQMTNFKNYQKTVEDSLLLATPSSTVKAV